MLLTWVVLPKQHSCVRRGCRIDCLSFDLNIQLGNSVLEAFLCLFYLKGKVLVCCFGVCLVLLLFVSLFLKAFYLFVFTSFIHNSNLQFEINHYWALGKHILHVVSGRSSRIGKA